MVENASDIISENQIKREKIKKRIMVLAPTSYIALTGSVCSFAGLFAYNCEPMLASGIACLTLSGASIASLGINFKRDGEILEENRKLFINTDKTLKKSR